MTPGSPLERGQVGSPRHRQPASRSLGESQDCSQVESRVSEGEAKPGNPPLCPLSSHGCLERTNCFLGAWLLTEAFGHGGTVSSGLVQLEALWVEGH